MTTKLFALAAIVFCASAYSGVRAQDAPPVAAPVAAPGYAWAAACRSCHEPIYKAWERTKHSTALQRLSSDEQEKECIGCHVTGPKARVMDGRKVLNEGVQCESCHGPGAAHAADPMVKTGLVKKPASEKCEECHSPKSPRFKGFWYGAMAGLVHKT